LDYFCESVLHDENDSEEALVSIDRFEVVDIGLKLVFMSKEIGAHSYRFPVVHAFWIANSF